MKALKRKYTLSLGLIIIQLILCIQMPVMVKAEENCKLYLDLRSDANLVLATYDIDLYYDGNHIGTVSNGQAFTKLIDTVEGKHELYAYKAKTKNPSAVLRITMSKNMTVSSKITHSGSKIEFTDIKTTNNISGAAITVPNSTGKILSDAENELQKLGFINIAYSPNNVSSHGKWMVIGQSVEQGKKIDKNQKIVLTCRKTDEILHEAFAGLNLYQVPAKAEEIDFAVNYKDLITSATVTSELSKVEKYKKKDWVVAKASAGNGREAILTMQYVGKTMVPQMVGASLDQAMQALKEQKFSNIIIDTKDGKTVILESNWEVTDQSISPWETVNGNDEIHLTVRKYEKGESSSNAKKVVKFPASKKNGTEKFDSNLVVNFEKPKAFRAAVVALTNAFADDVYDSRGHYNRTAFHRYFETDGDLKTYFLHVADQGTWAGRNENTWHVDNLVLERISDGEILTVALDVTYDEPNYIVHNIEGINLLPDEEEICYRVTPGLVEKGRDFDKINSMLKDIGYKTLEAKRIEEETFKGFAGVSSKKYKLLPGDSVKISISAKGKRLTVDDVDLLVSDDKIISVSDLKVQEDGNNTKYLATVTATDTGIASIQMNSSDGTYSSDTIEFTVSKVDEFGIDSDRKSTITTEQYCWYDIPISPANVSLNDVKVVVDQNDGWSTISNLQLQEQKSNCILARVTITPNSPGITKFHLESIDGYTKSHSISIDVEAPVTKSTQYASGVNVYVTPTGKRYHYSSSCAGKNGYLVTYEEAIRMGLTPCQKCAN